jgi:hypothetical protein
LAAVSKLEDLGWIFHGKYPTNLKDDIMTVLKSTKGKEALNGLLDNPANSVKVKTWFGLSEFETTINDSHIEAFMNNNFNIIFKKQ